MIGKTNAVVGDSTQQYQGSYNITQNGTLATANKKMTQDLVINVSGSVDIVQRNYNIPNLRTSNVTTYISYSNQATNIPQYAFNDCEDLERATFPQTVYTINNNAFSMCLKLKSLTFKDSSNVVTLSSTNVFNSAGTNNDNPNHIIYIYVPSDLVESYKTASNWSKLYNNGKVDFLPITE